jgi:hypothetical protein
MDITMCRVLVVARESYCVARQRRRYGARNLKFQSMPDLFNRRSATNFPDVQNVD